MTDPRDPVPLAEAPPQEVRKGQAARLLRAWRAPRGWRYWSEVNNTDVGLWYVVITLAFLLFGGILALVMRLQLAVPENDLVSAETYDRLFTMHGTVMMFLFAVPIFEAFSILLLPQMLGARDLPFPRLSAFGFWCFAIGGTFVCSSLFFGQGPRGGWFMYPPLSTEYITDKGPDIWLLGLGFVEIAAIAAAVELLVGVLMTRPPGMRINLIPLYAWYMLVVAVMILFAFPPLIAGDVLLELQRLVDWPFFDPERGGDPLLWQHLFWIFAHPEVYIIFLPSIALVAMIVPTLAGRPIVGYTWIVLAAVGTGFLSFGLWVHHMYTTGLPGISLGIFSAASEAIAIPTGVQLFCFIATILVGRLTMRVPMLFILGGLAIFVVGGLTGVMVALVPFDLQAHDTHFVVAHLHSVLIGGALFPIAAGVYYYFPVITGKALSERLGRWSFWLAFVGFNLTFLPMHLTGMKGMTRRAYTYPADIGLDWLNLVSTIGAFLLASGILVLVVDVLRALRTKATATRNPWNAGTLEWLAEMPPKPWGVRSIPEIDSRYPLWDQPNFIRDVDEGRFYLPDAEEGRRETLITTAIDAKPIQCLRVGTPGFVAMVAAAFTGAAFILATYHRWWLALTSIVLATASILRWAWTGTGEIPEKPTKDVGLGLRLPLYASGSKSVGWWALLITMLADMTAFVSLVFGYFFYWTVRPSWPPADSPHLGAFWPLLALALVTAAWLLTLGARRWNRAGRGLRTYGALLGAAALGGAGMAALLWAPADAGMAPTAHAYPAMVWLLVIWTAIHLGVGLIMQVYCLARRLTRRMDAEHDAEIVNTTLFWHFVLLTALVTVAVVAGFPRVA